MSTGEFLQQLNNSIYVISSLKDMKITAESYVRNHAAGGAAGQGNDPPDKEYFQRLLEMEILEPLIKYVEAFNQEMMDKSITNLGIDTTASPQCNETLKNENIQETFEKVLSNK